MMKAMEEEEDTIDERYSKFYNFDNYHDRENGTRQDDSKSRGGFLRCSDSIQPVALRYPFARWTRLGEH